MEEYDRNREENGTVPEEAGTVREDYDGSLTDVNMPEQDGAAPEDPAAEETTGYASAESTLEEPTGYASAESTPEETTGDASAESAAEEPKQDFYADGTPVSGERRENGTAGKTGSQEMPGQQPSYRHYQFGNEWRERQVAPQSYMKDPKKNGKGGIIAAVAIALAVGILGGAVFAGIRALSGHVSVGQEFAQPSEELDLPEEETGEQIEKASPTLIPAAPSESTGETKSGTEMSVADVAEMSMPAMVSITSMSVQQVYSFFGQVENREVPSAGSGIIVGQTETELLIATNDHVISGAKELSVCFVDEEVVEGVVKGTDEKNDLAIVAVNIDDIAEETKEKIRVISIGDSDTARIGESVVAIGNALGFGQSVSAGVISALNRTVSLEDGDHVLMQTDAAINPGNSGGALLNMRGELIGINEVKYVAEDTEGIGYAIPITFAKPILDELMNRETRTKVKEGESGYLGVTCITVTEEIAGSYGIPVGVFVDTVVPGEAAAKAGIQKRDIITKIGEQEVTTSDGLVEELKYYAAGETVTITVSRLQANNEYQEIELEVTLGKRPADLDSSAGTQAPSEEDGNMWQMPYGNR